MATTAAGTPYVESGDTASAYPTTSLALAQRVDAVEDKILYSGLRLPGTSGNYVSAPDAASLDITGDIDIRALVALDDWTPAATSRLVTKFGASGNRTFAFDVQTGGTLRLFWSSDGTATSGNVFSTAATGVTDGSRKWVRVTLDVNDGSGNHVAKFWLSDDGTTWTQLGSTVTTVGTTSLYNSSAVLAVGADFDGSTSGFTGKFYRAQVYNGIAGTLVADADFRLPWASRHRDSVGNTWTLNGSAWAWTVEAIA